MLNSESKDDWLNFEVNKKVFNPFLTNTSLWFADTIIQNFPRNPRHILEYGIGSGVVASLVYLNLNALKLFGIDSSKDAVQLARTNLKRNGINAEVELDWTLQSAKLYKYDLAICNPPLLNVQSSSLLEDSIFDHGLPTTKHFLDSVQDLLAINGVGFLLVSDREVGGVSGEKLLDDYKFAKPLARKNCGYEIYSCYVISKNA